MHTHAEAILIELTARTEKCDRENCEKDTGLRTEEDPGDDNNV